MDAQQGLSIGSLTDLDEGVSPHSSKRPVEVDNSSTGFSLWVLSRPKLALTVVFVCLCGYGWGLWDRALSPYAILELVVILLAWYILQVGTIWLNAGLDQDEGEVLLGRSVPVPVDITLFSYLAFTVSVFLAGMLGTEFFLVTLVCVGLSLLYSHPKVAMKGHRIAGPVINFIGYGLATPYVGWAVLALPANSRTIVVWLVASVGILGCYWVSQAFQRKEDVARGYETLVALVGAKKTILVGRLCTAFCAVSLIVLIAMSWLPKACLLLLALWFWVDRWYVIWGRQPDGGGEYFARMLTRRLVYAVLLTIGLALIECGVKNTYSMPLAGLGTSAGLPADRPVLPAAAMAQWEAKNGDILIEFPRVP